MVVSLSPIADAISGLPFSFPLENGNVKRLKIIIGRYSRDGWSRKRYRESGKGNDEEMNQNTQPDIEKWLSRAPCCSTVRQKKEESYERYAGKTKKTIDRTYNSKYLQE
jgi:hypothetical protein